jgi:hypothetical protein
MALLAAVSRNAAKPVGARALVDPSARFAAVQVAEGEKTSVSLAQKAGGGTSPICPSRKHSQR